LNNQIINIKINKKIVIFFFFKKKKLKVELSISIFQYLKI